MDQIIRDAILAALPDHDARRVRIDSTDVVNVVVVDDVLPIDVLGARPVAAQQNACPAKVLDQVAENCVLLSVQIDAYRTATAVSETAVLNRAVFGTAQSNQRVRFIVHVPVVLQTSIVFG